MSTTTDQLTADNDRLRAENQQLHDEMDDLRRTLRALGSAVMLLAADDPAAGRLAA